MEYKSVEFLIEYGMFLAKFLTVVLIILFAVGVIIFIILRAKGDSEQLNIKNILIEQLSETQFYLLSTHLALYLWIGKSV